MFNNSVTDPRGRVVGFRCWRCDEVKTAMWGETCNECRDKERATVALEKIAANVSRDGCGG